MPSHKNAAIVGCGNIAGFLDSPVDKHITTHAHAYKAHPETKLLAVCDPDIQKREAFISIWGEEIQGYDSLEELLAHEKIDILSICSPTSFHAEALKEALKDSTVSNILCEKPFVRSQEELDTLLPLLYKSDKNILINFIRRYDPGVQTLKKTLASKELGELLHFNASFTKGLYHNGSHMLELIEHLCGSIHSIKANKVISKDEDLYGSFYLETALCHGTVQNESGENYSLFELELTLSKGRIRLTQSGHCIEIEDVQDSKRYPGYFVLEHKKTLDDSMHFNLFNALEYLLKDKGIDKTLQEHLALSQKLLRIKQDLQTKHFLEFT